MQTINNKLCILTSLSERPKIRYANVVFVFIQMNRSHFVSEEHNIDVPLI